MILGKNGCRVQTLKLREPERSRHQSKHIKRELSSLFTGTKIIGERRSMASRPRNSCRTLQGQQRPNGKSQHHDGGKNAVQRETAKFILVEPTDTLNSIERRMYFPLPSTGARPV